MPVKNLSFLNEQNEVVRIYKFTSLPFKEQMIISKSIEFFSDPEPCFIHRSAVMKRLMAEMEDYFHKLSETGKFEISSSAFNERFSGMLNFGEDVFKLKFEI